LPVTLALLEVQEKSLKPRLVSLEPKR